MAFGYTVYEFHRSMSQLRARVKLESQVKFESTSNFMISPILIVIGIQFFLIWDSCFHIYTPTKPLNVTARAVNWPYCVRFPIVLEEL